MNRNFIALLTAMALFASCGGEKKTAEQEAVQPVMENETVEPVVYENEYIVKVGDVAPDFTLQMTDGTTFTLSEQRGKVVMLQFTAGWCGICREEMPHIERDIWLPNKDNKDFVLVGIDREETLEDILPFIEAVGTTYPIAMDTNADVFAKYALRNSGITRNVLIGRDGNIVMLTRKFKNEEFTALVEKINAMLAK
ncbi:MAG: redoxin family protein [Bacteroidaceae bacterium]|nr:redoxin family protein [Bacteroidaceae bacterium]MBO7240333.1 redoxin family protein [Bacteroidaceae bacterium]